MADLPGAIAALKRRQREILAAALPAKRAAEDWSISVDRLTAKAHATFRSVFGEETLEVQQASFDYFFTSPQNDGYRLARAREFLDAFEKGKRSVASDFQTQIELLEERLDGVQESAGQRALRAYDALDLHSTIADAATDLHRDHHYANAIEDSVRALNNLVRLKSGLDTDGAPLMTTTSSPKPTLRFNDLQDQSDRGEQRGFTMMFAGAVAGLPNPRARKLIKDDPERALEFIAYVSLLVKLLNGAKRVARGP